MLRFLILMMFLTCSACLLAQDNSDDELVKEFFNSVCNNDVQGTKLALEKGVDINSRDDRGHTALIRAGIYEAFDTFNFLLENGADLWLTDRLGQNILTIAKYNDLNKIVNLIIDHVVRTEFYEGRKTHFLEEPILDEPLYEPVLEQEEIGAARMEYSRKLLKHL
jgi:hypothetical protein